MRCLRALVFANDEPAAHQGFGAIMTGDAGGAGVIMLKGLVEDELRARCRWANMAIAAVVVGRQMLGVFGLRIELDIAAIMARHAVRTGPGVIEEGALPIDEVGLAVAGGAIIGLIRNMVGDFALGRRALAIVAAEAVEKIQRVLMVPFRALPGGEGLMADFTGIGVGIEMSYSPAGGAVAVMAIQTAAGRGNARISMIKMCRAPGHGGMAVLAVIAGFEVGAGLAGG